MPRAVWLALVLLPPAAGGCFLGTQLGVQAGLSASKGTKKALPPTETNNPPLVTIGTITASKTQGEGVLQGDIAVNYKIFDNESDPVALTVAFSTNYDAAAPAAATFVAATFKGAASELSARPSSPEGKPYQFLWDSAADLPNERKENVVLRFTPDDSPQSPATTGEPRISIPITIDNNDPPAATVLTPPGSPIGPSLTLGWGEVTGATGYSVYRGTTAGVPVGANPLATLAGTRRVYSDLTALPGLPYYYVVTATTIGESAASAEVGPVMLPAIGQAGALTAATGTSPAGAPGGPKVYAGNVIVLPLVVLDPNGDTLTASVQYSLDGGLTFDEARPLEAALPGAADTNNLTSTPAGVAHTFVWDVTADLGTATRGDLRLKVTPKDVKNGTAAVTDGFDVDFNHAPSVSALATQGALSGDIDLTFLLTDTNADPTDLLVEYSTDGVVYQKATARIGSNVAGLPSSAEGTSAAFVWNSVADLKQSYRTGIFVRVTPRDAQDTGTAVALGPRTIDNNRAPVAALLSDFSTAEQTGLIVVRYTLADSPLGALQDLANVTVRYSVQGSSFADCTEENPRVLSQGRTGLATSQAGVTTRFVWDSAADLGATRRENVVLQIIPTDATDGKQGEAVTSAPFTVNNTTRPQITVATPTGTVSGVLFVNFLLTDAESDFCRLTVEYEELAGGVGQGYRPAHRGAGGSPMANLAASPIGVDHRFAWNTFQVGLDAAKTVRLRFTPRDTLVGEPVVTPLFTVDNMASASAAGAPLLFPESTMSGGQLTLAPVTVSGALASVPFALFDAAAAPADLTVEFSLDGGINFAAATAGTGSVGLTGLPTSSAWSTMPGATFVWDAGTDMGAQGLTYADSVLLRFKAIDQGGPGDTFPASTRLFTVDNNQAPTVTLDTALAGQTVSGAVAIATTLRDAESDAARLDVEYSTNGTTWKKAAVLPGTPLPAGLETSPAGKGYTFTWDTIKDLGHARSSGVHLRLTAADAIKPGAAVATNPAQPFTVDNNDAPVVALQTPAGLQKNEVFLTYELRDSAGDPVSVIAEYGLPQADGSLPWRAATEKTGGASDGTANLSTTSGGVPHTFAWDTRADLVERDAAGQPVLDALGKPIPKVALGVRFRLTPSDAVATGAPGATEAFTVNNTTAPSLSLTTPTATQQGVVALNYQLTDAESNPVDLLVEYSRDGGLSYQRASPAATGDGTRVLTSSPGGLPHVYDWNAHDLGAVFNSQVRLRLTPVDSLSGNPQETGNFAVDNRTLTVNPPPRISVQALTGLQSGDVLLTFDLTDLPSSAGTGADAADLRVEYRGGSVGHVWTPAEITGISTGLAAGAGRTITWNSRRSYLTWPHQDGQDADDYQVRITPLVAGTQAAGAYGTVGPFTLDNRPPEVRLTFPNGGEIINGSGTSTVRWTSVERHKATVAIGADDGTGVAILVPAEADDGSHALALSGIEGTGFTLEITATDVLGNSATDRSDAPFTIDNTDPVCIVTAPNGGELLTGGTGSFAITWTTTDSNPGTVRIEYSRDGFANDVNLVIDGVPDTGTFNWAPVAALDSAAVTLRITPTDQAGRGGDPAVHGDVSDAPFSIDASIPRLTVTSPNGGEVLGAGGVVPITWQTIDLTPATVKIEYSTDNFNTAVTTIVSAAPDTPGGPGSYNWTLPAIDSATVKVRVTPRDQLGRVGLADQSDLPFSVGPVAVTQVIAVGPSTTDAPGAPTISTGGGAPLLVFGTGFSTAVTVTVGGVAALQVTRHSTTALSVLAPPGTAGPATLAVTNSGDGSTASLAAAVTSAAPAAAPNSGGAFTDDTASLANSALASDGPAWGDFDKDGDLDLYVAGVGEDAFFVNQGGGVFVAATYGSVFRTDPGTGPVAFVDTLDGLAAAWGDVNGDGWPDLFVGNATNTDSLFINQGDGTFLEEGASFGLANGGSAALSTAAVFADFDRDGDLDLLVANGDAAEPVVQYYENFGNSFGESAAAAGFTAAGACYGLGVGDFDRDLDLDVYLAIDGQDLLYSNQGAGVFTENSALAGLSGAAKSSRAVAVGDVTGDGWLDVYVANVGPDDPWLWINQGAAGPGVFAESAAVAGLAGLRDRRAALLVDYDHDGDLDLYVAADGAHEFWDNNGTGGFTANAARINNLSTATAHALAAADADGDGDLDLYVGESAGTNDHLLVNPGYGGNFLRVHALTDSDGSALDATLTDDRHPGQYALEIDLDGDGDFTTGTVLRRQPQAGSPGSGPDAVLIGIGGAVNVSLRVTFPTGTQVTWTGSASGRIAPNQELFVREP